MIVTGEASGDLHGAKLVAALRDMAPSLRFSGMGGPAMAEAGVELLFDAARVSVVGISEVFSQLGEIFTAQRTLGTFLQQKRPDLLILIDLPDFNLILAKKANKLNIPVFYYISPQVWAWRTGRVKTIAKRVQHVGVILPFEEQFLRERGVAATYVGHPLLDSVHCTLNTSELAKTHDIAENALCVGLLPGSRKKEVMALLPDFLAGAELLQQQFSEKIQFLLPLAPSLCKETLQKCHIEKYAEKLDIRIIADDRYSLMARCAAVVAASGTVTLELALLDVPTVVTYRLSPLSLWLARRLVRLDYFSLVNLIAAEEVIPELLQQEVTPESIASHLHGLLSDTEQRNLMKKGLQKVREKLGAPGASKNAARLALKILTQQTDDKR